MCGIAGIIGGKSAGFRSGIYKMTRALRHRGPNDHGEFIDDWIAIGHRRLSILDLSSGGRQPIWSADGRYAIVYNGEVYNYEALRKQLCQAGYSFQTRTDTEVVLNAFIAWGAESVYRLNGMFVFAIYDAKEKQVFICRDRLGIKPLYYARCSDGAFLFASEVRSLLESGLIPRRLNRQVLPYYLAYQSVPAPNTLIEGVHMLLPGHYMVVSRDKIVTHRYWHLLENAEQDARDHDVAVVKKEVRRRLEKAVSRRLVSDVPIGAFLSGGIDSSIIVGLMSQLQRQRVHTFSVTFDDPAFQDGHFARLVAKRFNTNHQEVHLTYDEVLSQIPEALAAQDQPSGDGINTYVVSKAVQKAGLTVALSGLGGDELFAGYSLFRRIILQQRALFFWRWMPRMFRGQFGRALHAVNPSIATQKIKRLIASNGSLAEVYPLGRQCYSSDQVAALLPGSDGFEDPYTVFLQHAFNQAFAENVERTLLTRISFAEARTYMHDVLLRDTDQMSMANALEVRVPFLDHELVEYVMGVTDENKVPRNMPKQLLVESVGDLLPEEVVHRPKQGFVMPFDSWMKGPLRTMCVQHLNVLAESSHFDGAVIDNYWNAFLHDEKMVSWSRLWLLVALGAWCEKNLEN